MCCSLGAFVLVMLSPNADLAFSIPVSILGRFERRKSCNNVSTGHIMGQLKVNMAEASMPQISCEREGRYRRKSLVDQ